MKKKYQIRFVAFFVLLMLAGQFLYYLSKSKIEPILIERMNVSVSVKLLNYFSPDLSIVQKGRNINSNSIRMTVAAGCDGMDGLLIAVAAILAFPMAWRYKLNGLVMGTLVIYLTNLLRIVLLFYILLNTPKWFDFFHIYVGQFMVIFAGGLFFLFWVSRYGTRKDSVND
ncbi:archaeosortase/exosortase family protein [uncultured Desulfobacter sp.]|uniref:archaeosortase/exosortase family protein n=1 Tax=uncultured Desulfobacter sp. TaxID=240139 RepID=UPI002AAA6DF0|nr:archaeosortase/exosortase family protein [uncultured Desulfobacter sp.]